MVSLSAGLVVVGLLPSDACSKVLSEHSLNRHSWLAADTPLALENHPWNYTSRVTLTHRYSEHARSLKSTGCALVFRLSSINKHCNMEIWPCGNNNLIKVCINLTFCLWKWFLADMKDTVLMLPKPFPCIYSINPITFFFVAIPETHSWKLHVSTFLGG